MTKFRFGYLVSGRGTLFQIALEACRQSDLPFEVVAMVANRANPALAKAQAAGLPAHLVDFATYANRADFDAALLESLAPHRVDGLMLNFDRLLGPALLSAFPQRILNLHMALLPLFPGLNGIEEALNSGMRFAGTTVHLIDERMDAGPIVGQACVPVQPQDDAASLGRRLFLHAVPLQLQAMDFLARGRLEFEGDKISGIRDALEGGPVFSPGLEAPYRRMDAAWVENMLSRVQDAAGKAS